MKAYQDTAHWNRCDECGRFISLTDLESGRAMRHMVTPDSAFTNEDYETLCPEHYRPSPVNPGAKEGNPV